MADDQLSLRWAEPADIHYLGRKGGLAQEVLLRKINQGEILLLCIADQPVGQLWWALLWSTVPFIDLINIEGSYQKQGLSRVLLGFFEGFLRERGYAVLYSSSQMDEPGPQAWHRQLGFEECGVINGLNDGGVGEVFFRKAL
jgi:GNAT superfamily N-acetyltransferase